MQEVSRPQLRFLSAGRLLQDSRSNVPMMIAYLTSRELQFHGASMLRTGASGALWRSFIWTSTCVITMQSNAAFPRERENWCCHYTLAAPDGCSPALASIDAHFSWKAGEPKDGDRLPKESGAGGFHAGRFPPTGHNRKGGQRPGSLTLCSWHSTTTGSRVAS
jgi:hypothetical protein